MLSKLRPALVVCWLAVSAAVLQGCATMLLWGCGRCGCDATGEEVREVEVEGRLERLLTKTGRLDTEGYERMVVEYEVDEENARGDPDLPAWMRGGRIGLEAHSGRAAGEEYLDWRAGYPEAPSEPEEPPTFTILRSVHEESQVEFREFEAGWASVPCRSLFWCSLGRLEAAGPSDLAGLRPVEALSGTSLPLRLREEHRRRVADRWWRIGLTPLAVAFDAATLPLTLPLAAGAGIYEATRR